LVCAYLPHLRLYCLYTVVLDRNDKDQIASETIQRHPHPTLYINHKYEAFL
jgi:hypothetical protein